MSHPLAGIPAITKGEVLFHWLGGHQKAQTVTSRLAGQRSLVLSGRPQAFGDYVEGLVLSHTFARLMTAAKSILALHAGNEFSMPEMRAYITNWFYWLNKDDVNRLVRLSKESWEASDRPIPNGVAKTVWRSKSVHKCYMCGAPLMLASSGSHYDGTGKRAELEHLWPCSYGGDSIAENLLPACFECNKNKKHLLSWGSGYVHSLMFPMDFGTSTFYTNVARVDKILLHRRAGFELARRRKWSLKKAFEQLGPYEDLRAIDSSDTWDFFNVENHSAGLGEQLWQPS